MSTKTKEKSVLRERGDAGSRGSTTVQDENINTANSGRTTTANRNIVGSEESLRRRNVAQGDTLVRKSIKYLSPILVALLLYSLYGSIYQATPDPPMNSATHLGPLLYRRIIGAWTSLKSDITDELHKLQEPYIHHNPHPQPHHTAQQIDDLLVRQAPAVHHPHSADGSHHKQMRLGGHSHDHDYSFVYKTHGLNPWDQELPKGYSKEQHQSNFFERLDEKRDNLIASLYGTTFDHKERIKKQLAESLKVFEETNLQSLREWNSLYDNSHEKLNKIQYKAKNGYREHREIQYQNSNEILGPLAVGTVQQS